MSINKLFLLSIAAIIALLIIGCGTSPTPTPAASPTSQVITVVITATQPPPTATPAQPTMTSIPTVALTVTTPVTTPVVIAQATKAPVTTPKPAATKAPTKIVATTTATALPMKFGTPTLTSPIWSNKDERRFEADDLIFRWRPVGGLQGDECYLLNVSSEAVNPGPGIGTGADYFVVNCGNGSGPTDRDVQFTLFSPKRGGPSYASIELHTDMWVHWSITVVKNLGQCDAANSYHCKSAPISPTQTDYFRFIGS